MKCLLVTDFNLSHTPGGAQRSNQVIIDTGRNLGHEIVSYNYDSDISLLFDDYDVVISSNLEVIYKSVNGIINFLASKDNHVRLEHDMNYYLSVEDRRILWESCKKSFFLTDFHHKKFIQTYGDIFKNVEIVPDPIDRSFKKHNSKREDVCLYVGFMHELKGTQNFLKYVDENPNKKFVAACWGNEQWVSQIKSRKNIEFLQAIPHEKMPELYNSVSEMFYCPECWEPFCRSVGEAILCGVPSITANDKIGCLDMYLRDKTNFADKCYNASEAFWSILEKEFK